MELNQWSAISTIKANIRFDQHQHDIMICFRSQKNSSIFCSLLESEFFISKAAHTIKKIKTQQSYYLIVINRYLFLYTFMHLCIDTNEDQAKLSFHSCRGEVLQSCQTLLLFRRYLIIYNCSSFLIW